MLLLCAPVRAENRLNNLVTELVNIENAKAGSYDFSAKHETWLFIRVTSSDSVIAKLDGGVALLPIPEAMHFVAAGKHSVAIDRSVKRLEIRTIPEIQYCSFPYHPWVWRMGPYDWAFLEKHINPHVSTMIGSNYRDLLSIFEKERVEYLVVGAHAVTY
jgi:hypothetical protein